jgi:hypothetical protein
MMIANVQPPAREGMRRFGASGLAPWPGSRRSSSALVVQMPAIAISTALAARSLLVQENQPALVELGGDWIRVVLAHKSDLNQRSSIFDMPPLNLGRVYRPLSSRGELLEEMLGDARF